MDNALLDWINAIQLPLWELEIDLRNARHRDVKLYLSALYAVRLASERFYDTPLSPEARKRFEHVVAERIAEKCRASL